MDSVVTLPDIRAALANPETISLTISLTAITDMLVAEPDKVWSLNSSLFLGRDATLQRTKSYNNRYTAGDEDWLAHGFMLDPGSLS